MVQARLHELFYLDLIVDQATALNALPTVSNGTANKAVCPSLPVGVDDALNRSEIVGGNLV